MLLNHTNFKSDVTTGLASVHNYYEQLVIDEIVNTYPDVASDKDRLADVCCVALNNLPPRYIRHNVDMSFFMSPEEHSETHEKVKKAIGMAVDKVKSSQINKAEE